MEDIKRLLACHWWREAGTEQFQSEDAARLGARVKQMKKRIAAVLAQHPASLVEIRGVGELLAAKVLADRR